MGEYAMKRLGAILKGRSIDETIEDWSRRRQLVQDAIDKTRAERERWKDRLSPKLLLEADEQIRQSEEVVKRFEIQIEILSALRDQPEMFHEKAALLERMLAEFRGENRAGRS